MSTKNLQLEFDKSFHFIKKSFKLSLVDKAIISHIFHFDAAPYKCIQTQGNIAKANGISRSTVIRSMNFLCENGLITSKPYGDGNLRQCVVNLKALGEFIKAEPLPDEEEPSIDSQETNKELVKAVSTSEAKPIYKFAVSIKHKLPDGTHEQLLDDINSGKVTTFKQIDELCDSLNR